MNGVNGSHVLPSVRQPETVGVPAAFVVASRAAYAVLGQVATRSATVRAGLTQEHAFRMEVWAQTGGDPSGGQGDLPAIMVTPQGPIFGIEDLEQLGRAVASAAVEGLARAATTPAVLGADGRRAN